VSAKPSFPANLPNPNEVREVLAYQIRVHRVTLGWSQERLAFECGLDRTYISAVERCRWNIALSNMGKIAMALNVPVWVLLKSPEK
jgi:transcriptional regulator with XRE-family HTH domain